MNRTNQTPPMSDIAGPMEEAFRRMQKKAEEVSAQMAAELEPFRKHPGTCPGCDRPADLDFDASLEASEENRRLTTIYRQCSSCRLAEYDRKRLTSAGVPPDLLDASFANFQVDEQTSGQAEKLAAVKQFLHPDKQSRVLILQGSHGTGKSHLAVSCLRSSNPWKCQFVQAQYLLQRLHGMEFSERLSLIESMHRPKILALDEIGGNNQSADAAEVFYSILEPRLSAGDRTIITTNMGKDRLVETLGGSRIESRMARVSLVVTMTGRDWRK